LGRGGGSDGGASSGLGGDAHAAGGLDALADLGGDGVGGGEEEGGGGGEGHEGQAEGLCFWLGEDGREGCERMCVGGCFGVFFKRERGGDGVLEGEGVFLFHSFRQVRWRLDTKIELTHTSRWRGYSPPLSWSCLSIPLPSPFSGHHSCLQGA
jgi:hypothetical protein